MRDRRERALAERARRQDGVVTATELQALGFSEGAIARRVLSGRLHRLYEGVYAVGHLALTQRARWRAAVAACGPGALLSHRSAAALWGLPVAPGRLPAVTIGHGGRGVRSIEVHHARTIREEHRALLGGVPVTSVARTLADLAGLLSERRLRRAVVEAERLRLLRVGPVLDLCRRGRRGSAVLRMIITSELAPAVAAKSELELRFLELCDAHGIPAPRVNVTLEGFMVDAYWPAAGLVVELDGDNFHRTAGDRRRDAARDRALSLAGHQVVRFGWDDVTSTAAATARTITTLYRRRTDPSLRRRPAA